MTENRSLEGDQSQLAGYAFGDSSARARTASAQASDPWTPPLTRVSQLDSSSSYTVEQAAEETRVGTKASRRRTRKARLRIVRFDPWSVMKTAFLFSIAFGIIFWVSTLIVWNVIESSGMFETVDQMVNQVLGTGEQTFHVNTYIGRDRVLGLTALLSAINIVLVTALATLFAFLYNLAASLLGGLEVTLAED